VWTASYSAERLFMQPKEIVQRFQQPVGLYRIIRRATEGVLGIGSWKGFHYSMRTEPPPSSLLSLLFSLPCFQQCTSEGSDGYSSSSSYVDIMTWFIDWCVLQLVRISV
jgi:hypothetical protein